MQTNSLSLYNPNSLTEQELVDRFVVRKKEFQRILKDIKKSDMKYPEQHYIIEAQRGYGKTTLLKRIYFEIKRDKELKIRLIPVIFPEEQYNIRKLFKLWEVTAQYLENESTEFIGFYDEMDRYSEEEDYEDICFKILEQKLKEKNKKLILLIDNISDILKKFKLQEQQKLREILLTSSEIRIIGASSEVLEFTFDYGKPFYDFFKQIRLKGLNVKETKEFLEKLGEIFNENDINEILKSNKGKIEALRRLTGGVPRTMILLFDIFVDNSGNAFKELEILLDRVTPLYKHRMDSLSPVQQEIVDVIALNWDAITTKEIASKVRMQSKEVSAQLNQLEKNAIVTKIPINKKNYMYQIKERFFNIWYLMRFGGKKEKHKVQWLVYFLETWCSREELEEKALKYIDTLKTKEVYEKYAYHMAEALVRTNISSRLQHEVIQTTRKYLSKRSSELCSELCKSDIEIINELSKHYNNNEVALYLNKLLEIKNANSLVKYEISILKNNNIKDFKEIEKFFIIDAEKGNLEAVLCLIRLYEVHINDYKKLEKYCEKLEKHYLLAIDKGDDDALFGLANLYADSLNEYRKAEEYYLLAIDKGHIDALLRLANLYAHNLKDYEKAEKYYLMAIDEGNNYALYWLASLYVNKLEDYEKAEKYYLLAIDKGDNDALYWLASLYADNLNDYKKAEKYYLLSIDNGDVDSLFCLAFLYADKLKNYEKAEKYYLLYNDKGDTDVLFILATLYDWNLKDYEKAEKYYLLDIDKGHTDALLCLANLYFESNKSKNKEHALNYVKKYFDKNNNDFNTIIILSQILLWNDLIEESLEKANLFLQLDNNTDEYNEDINEYFMFLMAKKQYNSLFKLFNKIEFKLKDKFKPTYYALMYFMKNQNEQFEIEYKKVGEELAETVEEIIEEVEKMEEKYK